MFVERNEFVRVVEVIRGIKLKIYELDKRLEELEKIQNQMRKVLESRGFKLTEKQLKVLELISQGYTPKEIAKIIGPSSEQTVYAIITRIRRKGEMVYTGRDRNLKRKGELAKELMENPEKFEIDIDGLMEGENEKK